MRAVALVVAALAATAVGSPVGPASAATVVRHVTVVLAGDADGPGTQPRVDLSPGARARARGLRVVAAPDGATLDVSGPAALVARTFGTRHVAGSLARTALGPGALAVLDPGDHTPVFRPRAALSGSDITDAYGARNPRQGIADPVITTTTPIVASIQLTSWDPANLTRYATDSGIYASGSWDPVAQGQYADVQTSGCHNTTVKPQGAELEVILDQEAILAAAPTLRQRTYTSANSGSCVLAGYQSVLDDIKAGQPIVALSTSWGACERALTDDGSDSSTIDALDHVLQQIVAAGVTVTAATGDDGIDDCGDSTTGADYPASSPSVLAMGGTTHTAGATPPSSAAPDTAWNSAAHSATGGGASGVGVAGPDFTGWPRPSWQSGLTQAGTTRLLPDLSLDGDPGTGIILSAVGAACGHSGGSCQKLAGGTSLDAPLMAGMLGQLAAGHHHLLGLVQPTLYAHPEVFTDVVALTANTGGPGGATGAFTWPAGPGFDEATGLGTPDLGLLEDVLFATGTPVTPDPTPSSTPGTPSSASGSPSSTPSAAISATPPPVAAPTVEPTPLATPDPPTAGPVAPLSGITGVVTRGFSKAADRSLRATKAAASVTIRFVGDAIELHFTQLRSGGRARVSVDGRTSTLDLYSRSTRDKKLTVRNLVYGRHTATVKALGTHQKQSRGTTVRLAGFRVPAPGGVRAI